MMKRNTIQRSLVLEAVNRLRSHATAEEVFAASAQEHPTISRANVYRNVNSVAESGDFSKMD